MENLTILGSSSITFISSSTLNIGTNLITVNTINPTNRYGGIAVIDSGSSPLISASFLYDSLQDEFIFVHKGTAAGAITSSHFMLGPETYNSLGDENYLTANRIPKGKGNEHLNDSNITDDGLVVSINSNTQITGTLGISGMLTVQNEITTPSGQYFKAFSDTSTELSWGIPFAPNIAVHSGIGTGPSGTSIANISTDSNGDALPIKYWNFNMDGTTTMPGGVAAPSFTGSFSGSVVGYVPNDATGSFVTNTQTGSFILNSQTGSMTVLSSSFATTASYIDPTFISSSAAASGFGSGGVTSITAGDGISVNQTTGNVVITNTGGSGGISQGKVVAIATGMANLF